MAVRPARTKLRGSSNIRVPQARCSLQAMGQYPAYMNRRHCRMQSIAQRVSTADRFSLKRSLELPALPCFQSFFQPSIELITVQGNYWESFVSEDDRIGRRSVLQGMAASGVLALATACDGNGDVIPGVERQQLNSVVDGNVFWRGDTAYETARGMTAYRANKPKRFPQVIIQAESEADVVAAVKFAKRHKLKVTTRSGGHSWSSAHIRDDCVLIDLAKMQEIEVDEAAQTLWVNPGVVGSRLNAVLKGYGLIVPTAHHPSPGIGGFCMNGGFGWNSRFWGNGAHHVLAVEVVNADGEKIYADENQNSDFWWAARGSGAGFFGVVTKMKLQCRPLPKVWLTSVCSWRDAEGVFDELMAWACDIVPQIPLTVETVIVSSAHDRATGKAAPTSITLAALSLADTVEEATQALEFMKSCPVRDRATFRLDGAPTSLEERYESGYAADPAGFRFAADNMYTEAPTAELVPRLRKVFLDLPTPRTHTFWLAWGPTKPFPETMALSMQGNIYMGTYTLWTDPAQDEAMEAWPSDRFLELSDLSMGGQMNDENMLRHPQRYFSPAAFEKLEALRKRHDPDGVFESFLGDPQPS
ncbi:MAG: FAD-binding oxidoreductase [Parvularculaceae bacterium]